jgi:hypothetical protein
LPEQRLPDRFLRGDFAKCIKWGDDKAHPIPRGLKRSEATLGHGRYSPTEPALGGTEADNSGENRTRIPSQIHRDLERLIFGGAAWRQIADPPYPLV